MTARAITRRICPKFEVSNRYLLSRNTHNKIRINDFVEQSALNLMRYC
jgi:hypothetical protein